MSWIYCVSCGRVLDDLHRDIGYCAECFGPLDRGGDRNRIVVDSGIVVWAVRYCLGRLSYAAADGYQLVIRCAPQLDDNAIATLRRDIREALENEPWPSGYSDIKQGWVRALAALSSEAGMRSHLGSGGEQQ